MAPRVRFEQARDALIGAEGILRDRPAVARVRVVQARGDDWGMTLQLEVVPRSGFVKLPSSRFTVSSEWKGSLVSETRLASSVYGRWVLYLDPGLTASLCAFAESLGDATATEGFDHAVAIERYRPLAQFIDEYEQGP